MFLTHWPLRYMNESNFQAKFCDWCLRWLPWNYAQLNVTRLNWWQSKLGQVMAWCCQATSHYLSQCWCRSILYGFTRPWGVIKNILLQLLSAVSLPFCQEKDNCLIDILKSRNVDFYEGHSVSTLIFNPWYSEIILGNIKMCLHFSNHFSTLRWHW